MKTTGLLSLCLCLFSSLYAQPSLVLRNVTVIDMTGAPAKPGSTVVISGKRIISVGPASAANIPPQANIINAKGKYLIPGLWDAHVHLSKAGEQSLALFIANGVTSVRDMGGDIVPVLQWRKEIAAGKRIGPRIKTAGPMMETAKNVERMKKEGTVEPVARTRAAVAGAAAAAHVVDSIAALGADFLKIRTVKDDSTYLAIAAAAQRKGLILTGHAVVSPQLILQAGQRSIEHFFYPPPERRDSQRIRLFRRMAAKEIFIVPTLASVESQFVPLQRAVAIINDSTGKVEQRRKYLSGYIIEDWKEQIAERKLYPFDWNELVPAVLQDLRDMHAAGMPFMAGTDLAIAFVYPGFSLHDELQLMVKKLGLTPMEALAAATIQPARFFHMEDSLGTVEPGKIADLVLLDANPLTDIGSTRKINAVILDGKYFSQERLQELLKVNR